MAVCLSFVCRGLEAIDLAEANLEVFRRKDAVALTVPSMVSKGL